MRQKTKVQFKTAAGKVIRFTANKADQALRHGSKKVSDYGKRKVSYQPYTTPAQRKAAANKVRVVKTSSRSKGMWARCPICHNLQAVKTTAEKNAWLASHVKRYHSK